MAYCPNCQFFKIDCNPEIEDYSTECEAYKSVWEICNHCGETKHFENDHYCPTLKTYI